MPKRKSIEKHDIFHKELDILKEYFHIPGLSVMLLNGKKTIFMTSTTYCGWIFLR
jgi:hypothetical protein